jgi:hypothetical protein
MVGFREFYVKIRKDIEPEAEMKKRVRERGLVQFSPQAFSRKKAYPVLAVDVDSGQMEGPGGGYARRQAMLLVPDDFGFVVWVDSHFFHYAGTKKKGSR